MRTFAEFACRQNVQERTGGTKWRFWMTGYRQGFSHLYIIQNVLDKNQKYLGMGTVQNPPGYFCVRFILQA